MRLLPARPGLLVLSSLLLAAPAAGNAQSPADSAAIRRAALDYVEGWYEGSAERMARAVHPELAKRIVRTDSSGASRLQSMTAAQLIEGTGRGGVRATMSGWVDYMHLARWNGEWRIVNVLWELKPRT